MDLNSITAQILTLNQIEKKSIIEKTVKCQEELGEFAQQILRGTVEKQTEECIDLLLIVLSTLFSLNATNVNYQSIFNSKITKWANSCSARFSKYNLIIDGNDGTGKSTLIQSLTQYGFRCQDRGILTKLTDDFDLRYQVDPYDLYVLLDCSVKTSRTRLEQCGKDLAEKYHTVDDLTYYQRRFLAVADQYRARGGKIIVINSEQHLQLVICELFKWLSEIK